MPDSIAIIPARGGSVRIPKKNIIDLNGKPAITYPIRASIHDVIRHHLDEFKHSDCVPEYFCIVYATAVLLEPRHLTDSKALLLESLTDFVLAVRAYHPHPFKALKSEGGYLHPVFMEEFLKKSQEFPQFYAPAGVFHWMRTEAFLEEGEVWAHRREAFVLEPFVAIDIDEPDDLEMARRLLISRQDKS